MDTFFGNIVKNILQEYSDGATNHKAQISYVDDDPKKGFYIYHACHAKDMQSIITAGARRVFVASNVCCSYGNGLYATYTLDSAKLNSTRRGSNSDGFLYGPNIVKGVCRNSLRSFAIFDPNVCEKVYGHKVSITDQLQMICSKDNEGKETFKMLSSLYYFKDLNNYYGFGLGASGYINNIRYTNTRSLTDYIKGNYVYEKEIITKKIDMENFMILGLRKLKGVSNKEFYKRYKVHIKDIFNTNKLSKKEMEENII